VFVNLLENAVQHGSCDVIDVTLRRGKTPGTIEVEVSDHGPGVPPSLAGRIFEPRVRGATDGGGAGLGLSIARGIVEAHGGTLALAPGTHGGASFLVTLRCEPSSEASDRHLDASWNLVDATGEPDLVVEARSASKDPDVI
jgi:signal transduction histidine kinase